MGDMGCVIIWGSFGGGAVSGESIAGYLLAVGQRSWSNSIEPDTVGFLSIDGGAGARGWREGIGFKACNIWRGGVGAGEVKRMVWREWGQECGLGEHVWDKREDGACDLSGDKSRGFGKGKCNWERDQ